jgi:hypothetical protein
MEGVVRNIKKGSTDQSVVIRIIDSTTGLPETAVEHDTSGIDLWYRREGATKTSITEAALAALDSAHSDGGIEHIGDGYYRLDLPDAAVASGANGVMVGGAVTGMIVIGVYVALVDYDPYDSVRAGLTALPNANADAAGGLPISDTGGLDLDGIPTAIAGLNDISAGDVTTACGTALTSYDPPTKAELDSGFAGLNDISSGDVTTACGSALTSYDPPTKTEMDSGFSGLNDISSGDVTTACGTALTSYDPPTKAELDSGFAGLNDITAADVTADMDANSTQLAQILTDVATATGYIDTEIADIPTTAEITAAIEALETYKKMLAANIGAITDNEDGTYTYKDELGATIFTFTISGTTRTRADA